MSRHSSKPEATSPEGTRLEATRRGCEDRVEAVLGLSSWWPEPEVTDDPTRSRLQLRWWDLAPREIAPAFDRRVLAALLRVAADLAWVRLRIDDEEVWSSDRILALSDAARGLDNLEDEEEPEHEVFDQIRTEIDNTVRAAAAIDGDELTVDIELTIARRPLAQALVGAVDGELPEGAVILPVYSTETMLRLLAGIGLEAPNHWQALGLHYDRYTLCVALHPGPGLCTRLFDIVDRQRLVTALERARSAAGTLQTAKRCLETRPEVARLFPVAVTPFHFQLDDHDPYLDHPSVARACDACDRAALHLALSFLARETELSFGGSAPRWIFQGHRRSEIVPDGESVVEAPAVRALCDLVSWLADDRVADKLELIQGLVSLHLGGSEDENYRALLQAAPRLPASARSAWKTYIKGAIAQYFENQRELGAVAASMVQRYSESLANLVKGTAAYGVTLLGFLFTQVLAEQSADALLDRQQMVRIFLIYSGIVLAALVVYSLSEEGLLRRELAQNCKRLKQYHTRQDLESYLEKPLQVRRRQFYFFLIGLMALSSAAVAWVVLTFTELTSSSA